MKFSVSQGSLTQALSVVLKGVASNATIPVLGGIYIQAKDGILEFQTTNQTIAIKHKVAANVEEEGSTVVSGKILGSLVKNLPDAAVDFELIGSEVKITCGKSTYKLATLPPSDFPEFPTYEVNETVELPLDLLQEMVEKVYKVVSKDAARPILSGILLTVEENTIRLVATDSFRLAVCDSNTETSNLQGSFSTIVAGSTFHDVLNLPVEADTVMLATNETQVIFTLGNTTYVSRKIEGTFPNYRQLLPANYTTLVTLDTESFMAALRRVSVIAQVNSAVRFTVDTQEQVMRLHAQAPDQGESTEEVSVKVEGSDLEIGLNYHYVFDCISAVSDQKEISLELTETMKPAVFKSYSRINYLYLLMPVRL